VPLLMAVLCKFDQPHVAIAEALVVTALQAFFRRVLW
jgi:hypothetical protein